LVEQVAQKDFRDLMFRARLPGQRRAGHHQSPITFHQSRLKKWAHQDSNLGPRDYESFNT
jgi:hypothetical protein